MDIYDNVQMIIKISSTIVYLTILWILTMSEYYFIFIKSTSYVSDRTQMIYNMGGFPCVKKKEKYKW